jgi:photosystem II stability/assembly factor-like uncharacterized protein
MVQRYGPGVDERMLHHDDGGATWSRCSVQGAQEQDVQRTYLGVCTSQVVGIQHYDGYVNNREMVRCASSITPYP